ncbi:MAG TPA: ABC transporter substrate-binding protein, partial [Sporosarcina sp.]|nr:ABC transporter substrate-binding protein [Sporosarcina sp.]
VRQAMWYAMDNETIGKELYHGLRFPATTLIIPVFASFHDPELETPSYDPEKAKALLDEAGYKDVDGDGFRENDKGEEFVLNFASMSGGETAEPIAQFYMQNWADVGIKVQLLDGRLHEFNSFYDMVEADDPKIDIYQGAWGTGSDPDPSGLYGRDAAFNYTRYTSEKNDELLAAGTSEKAFDSDYRKDIYKQWQELMVDEVPVAPTVYRYYLHGVNKRVVNYSIDPGSDLELYQMGVSE